MTAPMCVLYGVLSLLNLMSRYGRKIFGSPNSAASSSVSSVIGARIWSV
jgi:hypothetical protein